MRIELTAEQVAAMDGASVVEAIDPATRREYVVVDRAEYDRREGIEPRPQDVLAGLESPIFLSRLPTPKLVAQRARQHCRRNGTLGWLSGRRHLRRAEADLKLRYYFGGQDIAYLTAEVGGDTVVVAYGARDGAAFRQQLDALPQRLAGRLQIERPWPWQNEESILGGLTSHETPRPADRAS